MPGKQVEQHLGQAHQHAFLGHDGVAAQGRLEATAKCIALHQRDAVRAHAQAGVERMHPAHAALGVVEQARAVAVADQAAEQFQVAAQVEHVAVRRQHHVRGQGVGDAQAFAELALVAHDIVHQPRGEAGATGLVDQVGVHVDPVHVTVRFFGDAQGRVQLRAGGKGMDCRHGSSP